MLWRNLDRGQLMRVSFCFHCASQELNSGPQVWWQMALLDELSWWPLACPFE